MYYVTAAALSCLFPGSLNYVSTLVMYGEGTGVVRASGMGERNLQYPDSVCGVGVFDVGSCKISHFYRADCVTFEGSDFQGAWQPNKGAVETNSSLHPSCWGSRIDGRITMTVLRLHIVKAFQKKQSECRWEAEPTCVHLLTVFLLRFDPYWRQ